jgi:hypothetical protein
MFAKARGLTYIRGSCESALAGRRPRGLWVLIDMAKTSLAGAVRIKNRLMQPRKPEVCPTIATTRICFGFADTISVLHLQEV